MDQIKLQNDTLNYLRTFGKPGSVELGEKIWNEVMDKHKGFSPAMLTEYNMRFREEGGTFYTSTEMELITGYNTQIGAMYGNYVVSDATVGERWMEDVMKNQSEEGLKRIDKIFGTKYPSPLEVETYKHEFINALPQRPLPEIFNNIATLLRERAGKPLGMDIGGGDDGDDGDGGDGGDDRKKTKSQPLEDLMYGINTLSNLAGDGIYGTYKWLTKPSIYSGYSMPFKREEK